MDVDELQQRIDQELKALPAPRAPETLLPRVLAATVRRKPAPWYARPWLAWPLRWQVASVVVLLALGAGLSMLLFEPSVRVGLPSQSTVGPAPHSTVSPAPRPTVAVTDRIVRPLAAVTTTLEQASALVRACWKAVIAPFASWLLVAALSLSLACGALWSALERQALGGASRQ